MWNLLNLCCKCMLTSSVVWCIVYQFKTAGLTKWSGGVLVTYWVHCDIILWVLIFGKDREWNVFQCNIENFYCETLSEKEIEERRKYPEARVLFNRMLRNFLVSADLWNICIIKSADLNKKKNLQTKRLITFQCSSLS